MINLHPDDKAILCEYLEDDIRHLQKCRFKSAKRRFVNERRIFESRIMLIGIQHGTYRQEETR